jgi:hypothetical protein
MVGLLSFQNFTKNGALNGVHHQAVAALAIESCCCQKILFDRWRSKTPMRPL